MNSWTLAFSGFLAASIALAQPPSVLQSTALRGKTDAEGRIMVLTTQFRPTGLFSSLTGAPFSSDQRHTSTQTLSDGTQINRGVADGPKMFRDSQGRTRVERYVVGQRVFADGRKVPPPPMIIEIDDVVDGYFYLLDPDRKIAYRSKHAPVSARAEPVQKASAPPAKEGTLQTKVEDLGIKVIHGVQTEGQRRTTLSPIGSRGNDRPMVEVSEMWLSPQLELVVLSTTKSGEGESSSELWDLSLTEPSPDLFRPPLDYQVIDPQGLFTVEYRLSSPPRSDIPR